MHLRSNFLELGGVISHTELLLALYRCNKISCDNKGCRRVLSGRFCWVREVQAQLFHGQVGDPHPWCSLSKDLEEGWNESVPQRLFYWDEGVPNVGLTRCKNSHSYWSDFFSPA